MFGTALQGKQNSGPFTGDGQSLPYRSSTTICTMSLHTVAIYPAALMARAAIVFKF
jgi:hypothetical protein